MTVTPSPTTTATITPTPTATPTPRPIWRQIQAITLSDGREPLIASLSPDGKYLVVASWLTNTQKGVPLRLYLWEVGKPTPLWEIQFPRIQADTGWVDAFEWIPEYNLLEVTGRDARWWYFLLNISTGSVDWFTRPARRPT